MILTIKTKMVFIVSSIIPGVFFTSKRDNENERKVGTMVSYIYSVFPLIHKLHAYLLTVKEKHDKQKITNHSQPKERHKGNSIGGL